jgi:hypothetical protein
MEPSYCAHCGFRGQPYRFVPGSLLLEVLLWLFFIFPGIIYTGMRRTKAYYGCPRCRTPNMIPLNTPVGQRIAGGQELAGLEKARAGGKRDALILLFVLTTVLVVVIVVNVVNVDKQQGLVEQAEQKEREAKRVAETAAFARMTPAEHLARARELIQSKSPQAFEAGLKELSAIDPRAPEGKEAARLRLQYQAAKKKQEREQTIAQAAESRKLRDAMAKTIENGMLDEGWNVDVRAVGNDHTTLLIKWILVSKAMAHQLSKKGELFENARIAGFKKIEITDGYDETWYWNLK